MKTIKTIRRTVAMMAIFFAVTTVSCQKETAIAPDNSSVHTAPVAPTPPTPAVSMKPVSIITREGGDVFSKQTYEYNAQGKLVRYELDPNGDKDSVGFSDNTMTLKLGNGGILEFSNLSLTFNADKVFNTVFMGKTMQMHVEYNQTNLSREQIFRSDGTPFTAPVEYHYLGDNLSVVDSKNLTDVIDYYDNLPYQKGINQISNLFGPFKYYKLMEQENASSTILFNKLIHHITVQYKRRPDYSESTEFTYEFDKHNRVTKVTEIITYASGARTSQSILISTITY